MFLFAFIYKCKYLIIYEYIKKVICYNLIDLEECVMDAWIDSFLGNCIELTVLVRVLLSMLLGFTLGIEREMYKRPAGLRTHILVCVAACLVMLVSIYGFDEGDPARLAAQVVSGVGFLGAGAIMREDKGNSITGITTAATIWLSAMIGLSCGNGFYFGAILVTICSLIILTILRSLEEKISASKKYKSRVVLIVKHEDDLVSNIRKNIQECNLEVSSLESKVFNYDKQKAIKLVIIFEKDSSLNSLYEFVGKVEGKYTPIELKLSHE
jgi:putative Mg2+ transporter-C (MgtC) family protein